MTPELMEEGAKRLEAYALKKAAAATQSGGRPAPYCPPLRWGELDL